MLFTELGLKENTLRGVLEVGYHTPTPVQEQVIPYVLNRRDIFGAHKQEQGKQLLLHSPFSIFWNRDAQGPECRVSWSLPPRESSQIRSWTAFLPMGSIINLILS